MTLQLVNPSELGVPQRDAGGDNEVPRTAKGQPLIWNTCYKCSGTGRLPSEKKPAPATIKCQRCSGEGRKMEAYTRTTTFIDVLDDKSNIDTWHDRMTLIGVAKDPTFLDGVLDYAERVNSDDKDEAKSAKDWLNRRAKSAQIAAGSEKKADQGTFLHGGSELIDMGYDLPDSFNFEDIVDLHAYAEGTQPYLKIRHMEELVVNDQYRVAGTPDRVSEAREADCPLLVAPDGYRFQPGELLITDLKTGSVEYGALKMAMQLAMYAHSKRYDKDTGERMGFENINQQWGLIMHLPAGQGVHTLYWADLTLGWRAVGLAAQVREIRKEGRKALIAASS